MPRATQLAQPTAPAPAELHRKPGPGETEIVPITRSVEGWDGKPRAPILDPMAEAQAAQERERHQQEQDAARRQKEAAEAAAAREAALDAQAARVPDVLYVHREGALNLDDTHLGKRVLFAGGAHVQEISLPPAVRYGQAAFDLKIHPGSRAPNLVCHRRGDQLDGQVETNARTGETMIATMGLVPGRAYRLQSDGINGWWVF